MCRGRRAPRRVRGLPLARAVGLLGGDAGVSRGRRTGGRRRGKGLDDDGSPSATDPAGGGQPQPAGRPARTVGWIACNCGALSSVGPEHFPYKEGVGGSSPPAPTGTSRARVHRGCWRGEGAGLGLLEQPGSARFSPDPPSPPRDDLVASESVHAFDGAKPIVPGLPWRGFGEGGADRSRQRQRCAECHTTQRQPHGRAD